MATRLCATAVRASALLSGTAALVLCRVEKNRPRLHRCAAVLEPHHKIRITLTEDSRRYVVGREQDRTRSTSRRVPGLRARSIGASCASPRRQIVGFPAVKAIIANRIAPGGHRKAETLPANVFRMSPAIALSP